MLLDRSGYFTLTLPGEQFNPDMNFAQAFNPWQPLIEQVTVQDKPIPLLQMVWRTPLTLPFYPPHPRDGFFG